MLRASIAVGDIAQRVHDALHGRTTRTFHEYAHAGVHVGAQRGNEFELAGKMPRAFAERLRGGRR